MIAMKHQSAPKSKRHDHESAHMKETRAESTRAESTRAKKISSNDIILRVAAKDNGAVIMNQTPSMEPSTLEAVLRQLKQKENRLEELSKKIYTNADMSL